MYTACKCLTNYLLFAAMVLCFIFISHAVNAQVNQVVQDGTPVAAITFPNTGCVYKWVNDNPSIGLAATGTGNIGAFTAINNGTVPITATIKVETVPEGYYGYIVTPATKMLSVINLYTNKEERKININSEAWGMVKNADGSRIYISSENSHFITVFNTISNTVETTIPIVGSSWGLTISPDGRYLYAASPTESGKNSMIDLQTNTLVANPKLAGLSILASKDGKTIYGATVFTGGLYIYSIATNTFTTIPLKNPFDMIPSPSGDKVYISSATDGNVYVLDEATKALTTIKVGAACGNMAITADGKTMYVGNSNLDDVKVVDIPSKTVIKTIPIRGPHRGVSLGLADTRLYVISDGTTVVDTKTNEVIADAGLNAIGGGAPILFGQFTKEGTCFNPPITFTITVNPTPPAITATGTLADVSTVYGTGAAPTSFMVSGHHLPEGIKITPPTGFEVSADGITFSNTLTVGTTSVVAPTKVYLRLKLTTGVGSYAGDIVLSSGSGTAKIATTLSTVTAAPLSINASVTKKYGDVLINSANSTKFTAIGLKNNETIGTVNVVYGKGAAATDAVAIYTGAVVASGSNGGTYNPANYMPPTYSGNIEIVGALLTITADDKEKFYGDVNPPFTLKYSGFVNNEGLAQLTSLPVANTIAVPTTPLGQYPITISGAVSPNYTISYVPGTLTITTAIVTVTTAFTPNDDGINDTWEIKHIGQYNNCTVEVLNRYGQKVFYSIGYPIAWNGKRSGANLPTGTYYYIIRLNGSIKPLTGSLTIIR